MYESTNCSENHELNKFVLIKVKGLVKGLVEGIFGMTPRNIPGFIKRLIEAEKIAKTVHAYEMFLNLPHDSSNCSGINKFSCN